MFLPLILTYSFKYSDTDISIHNIVKKLWNEHITSNKKLLECFGDNLPKVVFKKGPSLTDKLINAKFVSNTSIDNNDDDIVNILAEMYAEQDDAVRSVFRCMTARCKCCTAIVTGNTITSNITNTEHRISELMSCNTANVIYVINCLKCNKQYVGKSPDIGLICDSTTDSDGLEQFSVIVQYWNADSFTVHEAFLGLYNLSSSTADALTAAIIDVFTRLGIPFSKLRGHSFDGASNMSGRIHGVQAQIRSMQPVSMYVHCVNHSLDLALQEAASDVSIIRNSLSLVKDCANVFRESAKRKQKLKQLSDDISVISTDSDTDSGSVFLLSLCPTRWCVRSKAVSRILKSWKVIVLALDELKALLLWCVLILKVM